MPGLDEVYADRLRFLEETVTYLGLEWVLMGSIPLSTAGQGRR